jgi:hypothetical protein
MRTMDRSDGWRRGLLILIGALVLAGALTVYGGTAAA